MRRASYDRLHWNIIGEQLGRGRFGSCYRGSMRIAMYIDTIVAQSRSGRGQRDRSRGTVSLISTPFLEFTGQRWREVH